VKAIVGLGNPGKEYEHSRHNTGFLVINELSKAFHIPMGTKGARYRVGTGKINGEEVILVKPFTFMNRSGLAVKHFLESHRLGSNDLIVIQDDLDLEFGRIKLKDRGGNGGHKGIASIIEALGSDEFLRVRIGIGRPPASVGATEYVLGPFTQEEKADMEEVIRRAREAIEVIMREGVEKAMNQFHRPAEG
jgi:PTH1 family peptidyl-tRNA hydrolase